VARSIRAMAVARRRMDGVPEGASAPTCRSAAPCAGRTWGSR
jgi:hypothetical protein